VFTPDGKLAGTNKISSIYGCVLHESWANPKVQGQSFNVFDADRGVWHQTWVDSTGSLLVTEGAFRNGAMTLSDATSRQEGREAGERDHLDPERRRDGAPALARLRRRGQDVDDFFRRQICSLETLR
jgi:hypothetical protein